MNAHEFNTLLADEIRATLHEIKGLQHWVDEQYSGGLHDKELQRQKNRLTMFYYIRDNIQHPKQEQSHEA